MSNEYPPVKDPRKELLAEAEEFSRRTNWSFAKISERAINDKKFLNQVRADQRSPNCRTVVRFREFFRDHPNGEPALDEPAGASDRGAEAGAS